MSVQVKLAGILKGYLHQESPVWVECAGETIREVLEKLQIPSAMVAMVVVNGILVEKETILQDQDVVQLIPLIGGG